MSVSEIVRFVSSYKGMSEVEKSQPDTLDEVRRIKSLIEENLPKDIFGALHHAEILAEASQDTLWMKGLTERAVSMAKELPSEDQEDLQPIFQKYLGHTI